MEIGRVIITNVSNDVYFIYSGSAVFNSSASRRVS